MNLSLTSRGSELWGAPRGVIYLAKILQGCATAGVAYVLSSWHERPIALAFVLCAFVFLVQKYVGHTRQWSGWPVSPNYLDWICDGALQLCWVSWFSPRPLVTFAGFALAWLLTYPWSQE